MQSLFNRARSGWFEWLLLSSFSGLKYSPNVSMVFLFLQIASWIGHINVQMSFNRAASGLK